jgi:hypothetical protein
MMPGCMVTLASILRQPNLLRKPGALAHCSLELEGSAYSLYYTWHVLHAKRKMCT